MLVVMNRHATAQEIRAVVEIIESLGLTAHTIHGAQRTAVCITGNQGEVDAARLEGILK
ncbi:MAG: hypothetical protein HYR55_07900 [Acidobacteria bacterium]|nr:hypothetical protein [Acidobacteriota bacterium]